MERKEKKIGTDQSEHIADPDAPKKRKKKNRWGDQTDNKAAGLMGLPTAIFATMTSEQLEAYALHLRIEEISQKLRISDVVPADGDRYGIPRLMLSWPNSKFQFAVRRRLRPNTTTSVVVSTPEITVTASALRMNDTNWSIKQ